MTSLVALLAACGCGGDDSTGGSDDGGSDGAVDATGAADGTTTPDATEDSTLPAESGGEDASEDAATEDSASPTAGDASDGSALGEDSGAEADASSDAGLDATVDAGRDAGEDAGLLDAGHDAGIADAGQDAEAADAGHDAGIEDAGHDSGVSVADAGTPTDGGVLATGCDQPFEVNGVDDFRGSGTDTSGNLYFSMNAVSDPGGVPGYVWKFDDSCSQTWAAPFTNNNLATIAWAGLSPAGTSYLVGSLQCCGPSSFVGVGTAIKPWGDWLFTVDSTGNAVATSLLATDGGLGSPPTATIYGSAADSTQLFLNSALGFSPFGSAANPAYGAMIADTTAGLVAATSGPGLAKLSTSTGTPTWTGAISGTVLSFVFDSSGDIIVLSLQSGTSAYLSKVSGSSGSVTWTASIPMPYPQRVWLDASDDIYVFNNGVVRYSPTGSSPSFAALPTTSNSYVAGTDQLWGIQPAPSGDVFLIYTSVSAIAPFVERLHFP